MDVDTVISQESVEIFKGSQEEVLEWLEERQIFQDEVMIRIGLENRLVSTDEYFETFG